MSILKRFFGLVVIAFAILTIVGLGILTPAVLNSEQKTYYKFPNAIPNKPEPPATVSISSADYPVQVDVTNIGLNGSNLTVARMSVVLIWIMLFLCMFGVKFFV